MKRSLSLSLPLMAILTAPAWAGDHDAQAMREPTPGSMDDSRGGSDHNPQDGKPHDHGAATAGDSESTRAFKMANAKMHEGMAAALTGDPDVDFMQGMIPHHQGAIDMAEVVLKYGKDPETRKLAEEVIKAQTAEIAFMKAWLAKRGK